MYRDALYAIRLLARSPGYSLIVIAVLAIGIGTNLLAFGLFQALALTPLSGVSDSADLQFVMARTSAGRHVALPYPDYEYLRDRARSYDGLAGSFLQGWMMGRGVDARVVFGELVTSNYFDVLGVRSQHGRALTTSDDRIGAGPPVAVIADSLWRREFNADPGVIGRTIDIDSVRLTIVGVAAADFRGAVPGIGTEVFVPYASLRGDRMDAPAEPWVYAFGRLRPGTSLARARAEVDVLNRELQERSRLDGFDQRALVLPIWQSPQGAQTYMLPAVWLMGGMAGLLLLVVCANVAGLVLVRSLGRRGEIAARLALGASRGRLVRLLLIENLLLAIPGAYLGLWLPEVVAPYLEAVQQNASSIPLYFNAEGGYAPIFALVLACASALLSGLFPALKASRLDLAAAMKDELSPLGRSKHRMRTMLVVAQVATSLILLVGAALVTRSLTEARRANPGFDARAVASVRLDLLPARYDDARGRVFYQKLLDALRADPSIESASVMKDPLLMLMEFNTREFIVEGYQRRRDDDLNFLFNVVGTDHFRTLRIPLVAGREFDSRDDQSREPVAIVNETLARRFFGDPAAGVGKRVRTAGWPSGAPEWRTIVGVARDIKYARLTESPRPYVYLPHPQAFNFMMYVHARATAPSAPVVDIVRRQVQTLDGTVPIISAATLSDDISLAAGVYDVTARTLAIVGVTAMLLTALGIYGLVAYTVKQGAHEIGIRMAIGASRAHIGWRYLLRGLHLGATGALVGIVISLTSTRLMASLLYQVSATDLLSFAVATGGVLAIVVASSLVPAWRAARVDPLAALRHH